MQDLSWFVQTESLSTVEEIKAAEQKFADEILCSLQTKDDLHELLQKKYQENQDTLSQYTARYGAFGWYVSLHWKGLIHKDRDTVLEAMSKQVPVALLRNIDVWSEIIWWLHKHAFTPAEMAKEFVLIKKAFEEGVAVLGIRKEGEPMLQKDLVTSYIQISHGGKADSVKLAEIYSVLKQTMFGDIDVLSPELTFDPEQVLYEVVKLVEFFLQVKPDDVWYIVETYCNSQKYEIMLGEAREEVTNEVTSEEKTELPEDKKEHVVASLSAEQTSPYDAIIHQINTDFPQTEDGNFEDVGAVLERLNELADQVGDESIRELFIFDEQKGDFRWNYELIEGEDLNP